MRKYLLCIFLFSFLYSTAQGTLKNTQLNPIKSGKSASYKTLASNDIQNQDGSIDNIVNYVNPVGNRFVFTVKSKKQTHLTVEIFSILGQRSLSKNFNPGKGISKFSMDVSGLPRGLYIVRFTNNNYRISLTRKLLKE